MQGCKLACDRIGHGNNVIEYVCMKKGCSSNILCCKLCIAKNHRDHNFEELQDISMIRGQVNKSLQKFNELYQLSSSICDICHSYKLEIWELITQVQQARYLSENPTITQLTDYVMRVKDTNFEQEYDKLIGIYKAQLENIKAISQQLTNQSKSLIMNEITQAKNCDNQRDEKKNIRFDIENIKFKQTYSVEGYHCDIIQVAISNDDKYVATGQINYGVNLWDISQHQIVGLFKPQLPFIYALQFSNNNNKLAIGTDYEKHSEGVIEIFDLTNLKHEKAIIRLSGHYGKISGLSFTDDSRYLISVSRDQRLLIWDLIQEEEDALISKQLCQSSLSSVTYSSEQQLIACCGYGGHTYLFDCSQFDNLKLKVQWQAHPKNSLCVVFIKDQTILMTSNSDETRFWNVEDILNNKICYFKEIKMGGGMTVQAYPLNDPKIIINLSQDMGFLQTWNYESNELIYSIKLPIGLDCQSFDITSNFSKIIIGGHEQNINVFERVDMEQQQ